jgi:hypothetical protein
MERVFQLKVAGRVFGISRSERSRGSQKGKLSYEISSTNAKN